MPAARSRAQAGPSRAGHADMSPAMATSTQVAAAMSLAIALIAPDRKGRDGRLGEAARTGARRHCYSWSNSLGAKGAQLYAPSALQFTSRPNDDWKLNVLVRSGAIWSRQTTPTASVQRNSCSCRSRPSGKPEACANNSILKLQPQRHRNQHPSCAWGRRAWVLHRAFRNSGPCPDMQRAGSST
jgi:hypothetical protein